MTKLYKVTYFDFIANDNISRPVEAENEEEAKVIAWAFSPYFERRFKPKDFIVDEYIPIKPRYKSKQDAIKQVGEHDFEKAIKMARELNCE